jgi:hypothetical protein
MLSTQHTLLRILPGIEAISPRLQGGVPSQEHDAARARHLDPSCASSRLETTSICGLMTVPGMSPFVWESRETDPGGFLYPEPRVKAITQPIAHHPHPRDTEHHRQAGKGLNPPRIPDKLAAFVHHASPTGCRGRRRLGGSSRRATPCQQQGRQDHSSQFACAHLFLLWRCVGIADKVERFDQRSSFHEQPSSFSIVSLFSAVGAVSDGRPCPNQPIARRHFRRAVDCRSIWYGDR